MKQSQILLVRNLSTLSKKHSEIKKYLTCIFKNMAIK